MLCDFAHSFPEFVGDLLEREAGLQRRFREESLTDLWVASLIPLRAYGVAPDLSIEANTGADLELWFLSRRLDRGVGFVIQAKRAECDRLPQKPHSCVRSWSKHRFPELDHRGRDYRDGGKRIKGSQARDLVQAARRTRQSVYPLYAVYTPAHIHGASGRSVEGVMLADGHEVRRRIVQGLWDTRRRSGAKRRSRAKFKQLDKLIDLLIPLSTMFCLSSWRPAIDGFEDEVVNKMVYLKLAADKIEIMNIPEPEEVAEAMAQAIRGRRSKGLELPLPKITREIPADIRMLAQGEMKGFPAVGRDSGSPARVRVAFVATRDSDDKA